MIRPRIAIAALTLCALFTVAAAPVSAQTDSAPPDPRQSLSRLTERARANAGDAAQIVPLIVALARHAEPDVRMMAADSLTFIARRHTATAAAAFSALASMIDDPDPEVQVDVLRGIAMIGDNDTALLPQTLTLLGVMAAAPDAHPYVRGNALAHLSALPGDDEALAAQVRDILIPLLGAPDRDIRAKAAITMWAAHTGLPLAQRAPGAAALAPLLNDPDEDVRMDADRYIRLMRCEKPNPNHCLSP